MDRQCLEVLRDMYTLCMHALTSAHAPAHASHERALTRTRTNPPSLPPTHPHPPTHTHTQGGLTSFALASNENFTAYEAVHAGTLDVDTAAASPWLRLDASEASDVDGAYVDKVQT